MTFEAVWYNGWQDPPAYVLIDAVEGETPEKALSNNIDNLTRQIRQRLSLNDWSEQKIQESLYLLRADALVSLHPVTGES